MAVYCAFLRGINVKGVKMRMDDLREAFFEMGFLDAVTILGTGNVVFTAQSSAKMLKLIIERALTAKFDYEAYVFLRNYDQIKDVVARSEGHDVPDDYQHYFLICDSLDTIVELNQKFYEVQHAEHEMLITIDNGLYWQVPKGETLSAEFGNAALGQKYRHNLTSRNMNTIIRVLDQMEKM